MYQTINDNFLVQCGFAASHYEKTGLHLATYLDHPQQVAADYKRLVWIEQPFMGLKSVLKRETSTKKISEKKHMYKLCC